MNSLKQIVWTNRKRGQYHIESDCGYTVSFMMSDGVEKFAAWHPSNTGNLYDPPRKEGSYLAAIEYCDSLAAAKYACEVHACRANGVPIRDFDPANYGVQVSEEVRPLQQQKQIVEMPAPKAPPEVKRQSQCETVEELVHHCNMSEGRARHVIESREQKNELVRRAVKACETMRNLNVQGYSHNKRDLQKMKPKELETLLTAARDKYKELKGDE